jgi:hypothetical protein
MGWFRDRALTIVMMAMFLLFLAGAVPYRSPRIQRVAAGPSPTAGLEVGVLLHGHWWEAVFENWESEFLQMAVFVLLTTRLVQKGSPESRRPHVRSPSMSIRETSRMSPTCHGR